LGSNDAANVFGVNVASGAISYRRAAVLASIFVKLGAVLEGEKCFDTFSKFDKLTSTAAFVATLTAAIVVNLMTFMRLPVSTSQAIMGAVVGAGVCLGQELDYRGLLKVLTCWVLTPIGGAIAAAMLYKLLAAVFRPLARNIYVFNRICIIGSMVTACYAAYNLGANNVANVTGTVVAAGVIKPHQGTLIGGVCIVIGILTYGRKVTETVGKGIAPLDPFAAWVVVLSQAVALHVFTQIGVPVSSSQAVVGAVAGVGLVQSDSAVNRATLLHIAAGWIGTVVVSAGVAYGVQCAAVAMGWS